MQIIPALYIHQGKPASYTPGLYDTITYLDHDAYEMIDLLGKHDVQRIILLDIDAAKQGEENNKGLIGSLSNIAVPDLEVGGGINDMDYLKTLQYAGVDYFILGSAVFQNFDLIKEICESESVKTDRVLISLDMLDGKLTALGWTQEVENKGLTDVIRDCMEYGLKRFIITDVNSDHPEQGPDLTFYSELVEAFPEAIFSASGHIRSFEDVEALKKVGVAEVVVGNEIYQEEEWMDQITAYNKKEAEEAAEEE